MGWFGGKSTHEKQVAAMARIVANLYEQTYAAPVLRGATPLQFELPDSRFRYLMFCLGTVHTVCARRMKNPDAVLNECAHDMILNSIEYQGADGVFDQPVNDPQKVANQGMAYLQDFLHRWSAYTDITKSGNAQAATSLVASMLRSTESDAPAGSGDRPRLWPLASAFEDRFNDIWGAFIDLGG